MMFSLLNMYIGLGKNEEVIIHWKMSYVYVYFEDFC